MNWMWATWLFMGTNNLSWQWNLHLSKHRERQKALRLTWRPGGSAAEEWALGPVAHSSCHWGANQRQTIRKQPVNYALQTQQPRCGCFFFPIIHPTDYKLFWQKGLWNANLRQNCINVNLAQSVAAYSQVPIWNCLCLSDYFHASSMSFHA